MLQTIRPSFWGKLFSRVIKVEILDDNLKVFKKSHSKDFNISDVFNFPTLKKRLFGSTLIFNNPQKIILKNLNQDDSSKALKLLHSIAKTSIEAKLFHANSLFHKHAQKEYLRDSSINLLNEQISPLIKHYLNDLVTWKANIQKETLQVLDDIIDVFPFCENKSLIRNSFEKRILREQKSFYDLVESNPLTDEQRRSVIRDNDKNLVLAAAGTGKTSVIIAKSLDLITRQIAKPNQVLILAYSKAAAIELRERFTQRASTYTSANVQPMITTFHALGVKILRESGIHTYLSKFSDDPIQLTIWLTSWINNKIASDIKFMNNFINLLYEPVNPFNIKTNEEYERYIRDSNYRTLNGEKVKAYQELLIANWLFLNGIEYEYEAQYKTKRRLVAGENYSPDFYLVEDDIYLEHFGIDRKGQTRPDIDASKYNQEMISKRQLHNEQGTTLIETFHYDWVEGNLENRLFQLMNQHEITINPRHQDEILTKLNTEEIINTGLNKYIKCLQAIRVEQLNETQILKRLHAFKIPNAEKYSILLKEIHTAYKEELLKQNCIDFDDMIIRACQSIEQGKFLPQWSHILVDEFQDVSASRMAFISALIKQGKDVRLTAVGDDWQSIYRFSGGKLELTTRFDQLVGEHTQSKLQKTFRYNNSIANTAGTFVMQNPEQYKKDVITHTKVDKSQVYLLDSLVNENEDLPTRVLQVINTIRKNDQHGSIAIIGRYRYLFNQIKDKIGKNSLLKNIKYWTFHGSKGLEADYCILIGLTQGKLGFPNNNKEDAVIEALLPSLDSFPHSEERRLMYVGITRAKKKSYLIADPMASSAFINELLSPRYDVNIASEKFKERYRRIFKCPSCHEGYLKQYSGKFGIFYKCTSDKACNVNPRTCTKCGSPSIDNKETSICNNDNCNETLKICQKCGRQMYLRESKYGKFWGCGGYGLREDACKQTEKYQT